MNIEQRLEVFKVELEAISDNRIREFTKLCLAEGPDYFFTDCPASSTGKYHPLNEISWDGTMIHTKKVFNVAYALSRGLGIEANRDAILCACIIHDLVKKGLKGSPWTQKNHPQLAAKLVEQIQKDTQLLTKEEFDIVYNSIYYHYGPWTTKAVSKPMKNYSLEELCLYVSDYVASKRFVEVQYKDVEHE
jgi:HD superfamily phosphohydrolase YqeK